MSETLRGRQLVEIPNEDIAPTSFSFGPFFLFPDARRLTCRGQQVKIGSRALDILIALVRDAGLVLSARDLLARVWPDTVVEAGSLRFHVVALRKAMSDVDPGVTYVMNVPGRGYTFVAVVASRSEAIGLDLERKTALVPWGGQPGLHHSDTATIVGRKHEIEQVIRQLACRRFVSIIGAGGIGKTTVANAVVRKLADDFGGRVVSIDLSVLQDSDLVSSALVSALCKGKEAASISEVCASIGRTRTLVFLDCCEHVIDGVAQAVEVLFQNATGTYILVTSREVVNVDGEFVYRLPPLEVPPPGETLNAHDALNYSAIRLFAERVAQTGCRFELTDENTKLVGRLCRELDGIALAIELAAQQLPTFGLAGILELVNKKRRLMWHGRRTAVPRHQTLGAMLDWSYSLLTELEQVCLRRLAVFVGGFTLDAAVAVAGANDIDSARVLEAINQLSNKSLLDVRSHDHGVRYFLLDTTRSYAYFKLEDAGELKEMCARHSAFYAAFWLLDDEPENASDSSFPELGNLRAALEWALICEHDISQGCKLVALYTKLLLKRSLLGEARKWTEIALSKLGDLEPGSLTELELIGAYAQALMFTDGNTEDVRTSYIRGLSIALSLGDAVRHDRLLCGLIPSLYLISDFRGALAYAEQAVKSIIARGEDASVVQSMLGVASHMTGDIKRSSIAWDSIVSSGRTSQVFTVKMAEFGVDPFFRALCGRARNLWLTGHYAEAERIADEAIEKARFLGHLATQCITLVWAGEVFTWMENWTRLAGIVDELEVIAGANGFVPHRHAATGIRGQLACADGRYTESIAMLEACLDGMKKCLYTMPVSAFRNSLGTALCANADTTRAILVCEEAIEAIEANGDELYLPKLLMTKANALRMSGDHEAAMLCLRNALRVAKKQGATAYEIQIRRAGRFDA
ncbi:ATP-binding protein [Paraburkholderia sp. LEh10]|uniref:ATP-binding protein n=1 Tax=Paraburkholderia sp. LEh10 TaxID=2821353 RepID=UPI001FD7B880|nr:winged helix-turn-helix domain-containing protein [Paraburkholderia sp. LEh10]